MTWANAESYCQSRYGTNLATILSADDNAKVLSILGSEHGWIGLSDSATEGTWVWNDGRVTHQIIIQIGQVVSQMVGGCGEDCATFRNTAQWTDYKCDNFNNAVSGFVCNGLPTSMPTDRPTNTPTDKPTDTPTNKPTDIPTNVPTDMINYS